MKVYIIYWITFPLRIVNIALALLISIIINNLTKEELHIFMDLSRKIDGIVPHKEHLK